MVCAGVPLGILRESIRTESAHGQAVSIAADFNGSKRPFERPSCNPVQSTRVRRRAQLVTQMTRCRLRFLLHEFDLSLGVTTIGRAADCHVTLDDPLVSRRHARIVRSADRVVIEDMDSRNGVLVNGTRVRGMSQLRHGARVRVGTQEFVFHDQAIASATSIRRVTGELRLCASCHLPYPRQLMSCPACEDTEQIDEDTLSGGGYRAGRACRFS